MKPPCPRCSSTHTQRNGRFKGRQLYRCGTCGSQFGGGEYLHGGRFSVEVVADAVRQYYLGLTYREAAGYVMNKYRITDTRIADSTVREWVRRWTDVAFRRAESLRVSVGLIWSLDGSVLDASGQRCWQVTDHASRYIIAMDCLAKGAEHSLPLQVMATAISSANSPPEVLVCRSRFGDGLFSPEILGSIKIGFPEIKVRPPKGSPSLMPDRVRPDGSPYPDKSTVSKLRRFKTPGDVQRFVRGWWVSYNFMENKQNGAAPPGLSAAESAPFSSWADVVRDGRWR